MYSGARPWRALEVRSKFLKTILKLKGSQCREFTEKYESAAVSSYISSAGSGLMWQHNKTTQSILDVICQASGLSKACHWWANKLASLLAESCGRTGGDSWARYKLQLIGDTLSTCCRRRQLFSSTARLCRRRGVLSVLSLFGSSLNSEGTVVEPLPKSLCIFAPLAGLQRRQNLLETVWASCGLVGKKQNIILLWHTLEVRG